MKPSLCTLHATHDAKEAAITANLVNLAHALGLVSVAEGIESPSQLTSMQSFGCDLGQGYLFVRPMPADQLTDLLANSAPQFAPDEAAA
jgi:diguanylate cyclase